MKLLDAALFRAQRLVPSAERGSAICVVALLGGLEVVGRNATSDLYDLLAGVTLLLGAMCIAAWHRSNPVPWVTKLSTFATRQATRFDQLKYDVGLDFRGVPPLPRRVPRLVYFVFLGMIAWDALALALWAAFPDGWRELGLRTSYVLYLVVLVSLWLMLFVTVAASIYLPVYVFDNQMRKFADAEAGGRRSLMDAEPPPQSPDAVALIGYWMLAMLVTLVTPPVYGLILCGVVAVLSLVSCTLPTEGDANILWRTGGRKVSPVIYSVPMRRILSLAVGFASVLIATLILWSCGGRLTAPPTLDSQMVVTGFLGALAAWLVPGVVLLGVYQLFRFRRMDPTRRDPLTVRVDGTDQPIRVLAGKLVRRWGVRTAFAPAPEVDAPHVGLRLVPAEQSEATEFDPQWPLKVSLDDLRGDTVKERVVRRDEIQLRRRFLKGLAKLLKQSALLVPEEGGGFWIAPHWWFVETLLWEAPPKGQAAEHGTTTLRPVGPTFEKLFGQRVRQHVHAILRATQIDLIYLEDGVNPRKLEKVLRQLLELYDVHGGKRRAEDHHFQGIPKVRVMFHEYSPGNEFRSDVYPEPKFDDVSRFRVMHVFRDRDDSEETVEPPFDFSWEPSPLAIS
ncbi:hypothetical protein [Limnoglobus roseus]|uniref:Uncharacterized protein n=1 Tax=Limnoglobus roseus TaxID=2598579 RepID=A0A5C1A4A7_9BACT|nr:hypothetical protein [Limnoglobus roseus]QEL13195.1 hypothetical protein PX52LOC_00048 [Limnoglobus roseus]